MLQLFDKAAAAARCYRGPERRRLAQPPPAAHWQELMLDEIDYGMLLVDEQARLLHMNHAARVALDDQHPLQLQGRELRARRALDVMPLRDALQGAHQRGLRRLIMLGDAQHRVAMSVVPLALPGGGRYVATQLLFGKRAAAAELSAQWFARSHGLTQAETRVLEALSEGLHPSEIATRFGVGIATIRSQICCIRAKTHADSIGALLRLVAALPPLVGVLRHSPHRATGAQPLAA
ncbi:MAG: helix-turn-helix transcriptional regulator [Rubrivivax sp.]